MLIAALWLLPETTLTAVGGILDRTVKVADTEPTVICTVMVVPPGLITYPAAVDSPVTLVTVLALVKMIDPDVTLQVTGNPGIEFLKASVTCTRNGTGRVVPVGTT